MAFVRPVKGGWLIVDLAGAPLVKQPRLTPTVSLVFLASLSAILTGCVTAFAHTAGNVAFSPKP